MGCSDGKSSSSILALLKGQEFCGWHRIGSDEYFCHHSGSVYRIHMIDESGNYSQVNLGDTASRPDCVPQFKVKKGLWFCQDLEDKSEESFALVSCIVVPAYTWETFSLGSFSNLVNKFPHLQ